MTRIPRPPVIVCAAIVVVLSGCATKRDHWAEDRIRTLTHPAPQAAAIVQTGFPQAPIPPAEPVFGPELTPEAVIQVVLDRNPTLDQMRAAAEAAAARFPQVTSLDDPGFSFNTAPGSAWSANTDYSARVELSQKFLYPGKRSLKGRVANAEAAAATRDFDDARLALVAAAKSAIADYYLAEKGKQVAQENQKFLFLARQNAEAQSKVGRAPQQDILQANVELARLDERLVRLRRDRLVAVARINALMHAPPDSPLPPPAEIRSAAALPDAANLRASATKSRPDLQAALDRLAADEAALALAQKDYNPDVELVTAYDGFWQGQNGRPLQWQIGARVNLPVRYARRDGAVAEAQAKVARRRAELARLSDRVNLEVQEAFEDLREAEEVVRLYEAKVLPAAELNVKGAQTAYENSKIPFLSLIEAQRNHVGLKDRFFEAVAETVRRRAALERAIGGPISPPPR